jgi:hypothetical protein
VRASLLFRPRVRGFILFVIVACATANALQADKPDGRRAAIDRALAFLHTIASDDKYVDKYGSDLLVCFETIAHTARDGELSASAARMGRELTERWRKSHQHVSPDATADDIYNMVAAAYAADRLGFPDPGFKAELRKAALRFTARDYVGFDPARDAPHTDDPKRYDAWSNALIKTYFGDAYGVRLGAHYRDVEKWVPRFRPYQGDDEDLDFDSFYATTHLVYTLNRYNERRIAPSLLPEEIAFLQRKLDEAMDDDDPEMVGEALDCLKAAGFENDPQVKKGMAYLISNQRPDGTWAGDPGDVYTQYHSAWTSIDGLRDYRYRGTVTKLPGN